MSDGALLRAADQLADRVRAGAAEITDEVATTHPGGSRVLFVGLSFDWDEANRIIVQLLKEANRGLDAGVRPDVALASVLRSALIIGAMAES